MSAAATAIGIELALKYGLPLAIKLLNNGKDETETQAVVTAAITGITSGTDATETLLKADDAQTASIVDGLFNVITGAAGGLFGLIGALGGLFKKK